MMIEVMDYNEGLKDSRDVTMKNPSLRYSYSFATLTEIKYEIRNLHPDNPSIMK